MDSFGEDKGTFDVFFEWLAYHGVINTPAFVVGTRIGAVTPPTVLVGFVV
jgi:hypothetical protein